ncbi:RING finger protein, putative [Perkinsus marinus ATCC 50983]|uniref:RING-type E3 ubiquitin transferase n=1 Tax=Perkinsus marinus (strain ATCC 50983 / TXsc) TaxID=423536 RepID=C5LXN9_PERM5|nr:RING finger protein, putative [Perkinsus marinus ATCC 50983]EEQ98503.1 RING finger protein, putative [Perkinsus marinus ATCC 50983]|eukprot:XP_002765786.1 RING finger protein, putative [Perkinsus marinus ATCC 50983]
MDDASRDSGNAAARSGGNDGDDRSGGGRRGFTMRIGGGGRGASNPYYCHECRKSIPRLTDDNKCPECNGGFVEAARIPADDLIHTLMMLAGAERSQTEESSNAMNRRQQDEANPCTCKAFIERLPVAPKRVKTEMKADDLIESSVAECSICTMEFEKEDAEDSNCTSLPCEHFFHRDCLVPWVEKSDSCPVCR